MICWDGAGSSEVAGQFVEISVDCGLRADGSVICWAGRLKGDLEGKFTEVRGGWPLGEQGPTPGSFVENPEARTYFHSVETLCRAADFACALDADGFVHCLGAIVR